jgi:hypothetical protein
MLLAYYIICVIYCFYKLFVKYQKNYNPGMIGLSPGLDTIMVLVMAWVLAPVDISLTWIKIVKETEVMKNIKKRHTDRWI